MCRHTTHVSSGQQNNKQAGAQPWWGQTNVSRGMDNMYRNNKHSRYTVRPDQCMPCTDDTSVMLTTHHDVYTGGPQKQTRIVMWLSCDCHVTMLFCTSFSWSRYRVSRVGSCPKASAGVVHGWRTFVDPCTSVVCIQCMVPLGDAVCSTSTSHVCQHYTHPLCGMQHIFTPLLYKSPCLSSTPPIEARHM